MSASFPREIDDAPIGSLIWHSSGEDEGPDVGVSIKLGDDKLLWCGEITDCLCDETEGASELGGSGGWWLILYEGPSSRAFAKCCDEYAARDAFDEIATLAKASPPIGRARDRNGDTK